MPAANFDPRNNSSAFQEDLAAKKNEQDELDAAQAEAEQAELERMYMLEMEENRNMEQMQRAEAAKERSPGSAISGLASSEAKKVASRAVVQGGKVAARAGASAAMSAISFLAPWVLGILAAIILIIGIILIFVTSLSYACNQPGTVGWGTRLISSVASYTVTAGADVCAEIGGLVGSMGATMDIGNSTGISLSEQEIRENFAAYGIGVNKGCVNKLTRYQDIAGGQTCLEGMNSDVIAEIIILKGECDAWLSAKNGKPSECNLTVTGGTEAGHASGSCSHSGGYKIDLSLDSDMDAFIIASGTPQPPRGSDPVWRIDARDAYYTRESDHWDISVGCA